MTQIVKLLANTAAIGTSNTSVGNARLVRVLNTVNTAALITLFSTLANTQIGTYVLNPLTEVVIQKKGSEVLTSNNAATVLGVPVASTY
jgi:hypothetical protein